MEEVEVDDMDISASEENPEEMDLSEIEDDVEEKKCASPYFGCDCNICLRKAEIYCDYFKEKDWNILKSDLSVNGKASFNSNIKWSFTCYRYCKVTLHYQGKIITVMFSPGSNCATIPGDMVDISPEEMRYLYDKTHTLKS